MACLSLSVVAQPQAALSVAVPALAALAVEVQSQPTLEVAPKPQAGVSVEVAPQATLAVVPQPQAQFAIGEVCSVSGGELCVLAASDGPLRTRDGGYILLDPAGETD